MDKSRKQLERIERLSRQTHHHQLHLNHMYNTQLNRDLEHMVKKRDQYILRSLSCRQLERERKSLVNITIGQMIQEQHGQVRRARTACIEQHNIDIFNDNQGKYDHLLRYIVQRQK
jgi:hypothetical protein